MEIDKKQTEPTSKYQYGKIYTLRSSETEKYYIGSTIQPLPKVLYEHKKHYRHFCKEVKKWEEVEPEWRKTLKSESAFEIAKYDDCYIELLENCCCDSLPELKKRQGELVREHKEYVVNLTIPGRTRDQFRRDNPERYKAYEQKKKDDKKRRHDFYNLEIGCVCGKKYTQSSMISHCKKKHHQSYINSIEYLQDIHKYVQSIINKYK
jgi:hypothetical protein